MDLELSRQKLALTDHELHPPGDIRVLEQRLAVLEEQGRQRQTRDMVLYPLITVYFAFKILNWLINR